MDRYKISSYRDRDIISMVTAKTPPHYSIMIDSIMIDD